MSGHQHAYGNPVGLVFLHVGGTLVPQEIFQDFVLPGARKLQVCDSDTSCCRHLVAKAGFHVRHLVVGICTKTSVGVRQHQGIV